MSVDQIRLDRPTSGRQRLEGRFGGHAYDLHRHETYGVGLTLYGVQQFHDRGSLRASRARQVLVLHPDEAHDGHAGEGVALSEAAAAAGFADQSHLTRHFSARFGVTPGRWAAQSRRG